MNQWIYAQVKALNDGERLAVNQAWTIHGQFLSSSSSFLQLEKYFFSFWVIAALIRSSEAINFSLSLWRGLPISLFFSSLWPFLNPESLVALCVCAFLPSSLPVLISREKKRKNQFLPCGNLKKDVSPKKNERILSFFWIVLNERFPFCLGLVWA